MPGGASDMAKQPHPDDDQAKKPAGPKTPKPGKGETHSPPPAPDTPPRQVSIPNMSIDDNEPLEVEEVIDEEVVPVVEAVDEPFVLSDEDVIEEAEAAVVAQPVPDSDVFLAEPE